MRDPNPSKNASAIRFMPDIADAGDDTARQSATHALPAVDGFRPDIEGMRAVAVALVVAFHLGLPGLSGGFIGVDVFFVISGYLITGLLLKEIEKTGRLDLLGFYARRARRLLPSSFVVLLATLLTASLILAPGELHSAGKSAAASAAYISNFWFMLQARDYFSPESALNPFLHTWSLGVEEQFYFVWPVFLLMAASGPRASLRLAIFIGLATALSLIACLYLVNANQAVAFYSSPTRVWEFGLGALATLVPASAARKNARLLVPLAWLGLAAVLASAAVMTERTAFPGWSAAIPVAGTASILLAGSATQGRALKFLGMRAMQYIGRRSYAIYLWHWPVIVLALILWPEMTAAGKLACLIATLALSAASFKFVESPVRSSAALAARKSLVLPFAALLTVTGVLAGQGTMWFGQRLQRQTNQQSITRAQTESSALAKLDCRASLAETEPRECRFGNPNATRKVVLFGDSHAAQWFTPINAIAAENHAELITILKASCAASDVTVVSSRLRRSFRECAAWRHAAVEKIIAMNPDAIILAQHSLSYVRQDGVKRTAASVSPEEWLQGLSKTLAAFRRANIPTIVLADTPDMSFDVPTCLGRARRWGSGENDCGLDRGRALNDKVTDAERKAIADNATARYVDMTDTLCPGAVCSPIRGEQLVYRDANHISEGVALDSTNVLRERMGALIGPR